MTAKFSESWVGDILDAAGEKGVAANAIEEFHISERARRAEYWKQNPILRVANQRLYQPYLEDGSDRPSDDPSVKQTLAIAVLLSILAISLTAPNSVFEQIRDQWGSVAQAKPINLEQGKFVQPSPPTVGTTMPLVTNQDDLKTYLRAKSNASRWAP